MIYKTQSRPAFLPGFARLAALVLAALTLCTALTTPSAQAADWMEPYLEQVQEWGVMRGDSSGNLNADRPITRAEMATFLIRALGTKKHDPHANSDVNHYELHLHRHAGNRRLEPGPGAGGRGAGHHPGLSRRQLQA